MEISDARHCEIDMSQETGERKREGERDSEDERRKEEGSERKDDERRKKHWHALVPRAATKA